MKKMRLSSRLLIALASLAMTAAFFLPLWAIYLFAPQYPEGLAMQIWLTKLSGQVEIINGLNHYIGMRHINEAMFPEFSFMVYILGGFVAFGMLVAATGSRKLLFALLVLSVLTAAASVVDFYRWGYDYGHNLNPAAAIKVPGLSYQPPVIGHKKLLNFDAYSYPDMGGWIIIGAGSVFFLVYGWERWRNRKKRRSQRRASSSRSVVASKAIVSAALLFTLASCSHKPEPFAYGKEACDDCRMTIVEPHFGAELLTKKGRVYKFDDAHCLHHFLQSGTVSSADVSQLFFVDYNNTKSFVEASAVWFAAGPQIKSPMNSNAAAFATKEAAASKATETGSAVKSWTELQKDL